MYILLGKVFYWVYNDITYKREGKLYADTGENVGK